MFGSLGIAFYAVNFLVIIDLHWSQEETSSQLVAGVPISIMGGLYGLIFNLSFLTLILKWTRAKFTSLYEPYEGAKDFCIPCSKKQGRGVPKAERTHHCKICDTCVFKMQKHCFWLGCCIG